MEKKVILNENIYKQKANIVCRKIGSEYVLVPVTKKITNEDNFFGLNSMGSYIWQSLDGKLSVEAIVNKISDESNHDLVTIRSDCNLFLEDLISESLIERI